MSSLLIQIIGLLATGCVLWSFQQKQRSHILLWLILGQILFALHFGWLGAFTASAANIIAIVRGIVFYFKPSRLWAKLTIWPYLFIGLIGISGYLTWQGWQSALVLGAMAIETTGLWSNQPRTIRRVMLGIRPIYFTYSLLVGSYAGMLADVIFSISIIIGMMRFDRSKNTTIQ